MNRFQTFVKDMRRSITAWHARNPALIAAGLSYFSLFSLIPLTVLTITAASSFFRASDARALVMSELTDIFSTDAAQSISMILKHVEHEALPASAISVVVLGWFASRLFIQLQLVLTAAWEILPPPSRLGRVKIYIGNQFRAITATLGFGLLAFVFFIFDVVGAYFRELLSQYLPHELLFQILPAVTVLASLVLFTLGFAMIYRWLPAEHPGWTGVWAGALLSSVLFTFGRIVMTFYLHHRNFLSLFGAAGAVVIILIWVYYSMQILLLGAMYAAVVGERKQNPLRHPAAPSV